MKEKSRYYRILALLMTMLVTLSMVGSDFATVFAEEGQNEDPVIDVEKTTDEATSEEIEGYERIVNDELVMTEESGEELLEKPDTDVFTETRIVPVDAINGKWINAEGSLLNVRATGKQTPDGYNVLQGSCSDGEKYVYCAFNNKSDDAVKIVKFLMTYDTENPEKVSLKYVNVSSKLTGIVHGNDMTYVKNPCGDGQDKILLITAARDGHSGNFVDVFDVDTFKEIGGKTYKYWNNLSYCDTNCYPENSSIEPGQRKTLKTLVGDHHGFANIDYNATSKRIVMTCKTDRDLLVFEPVWKNGTLYDMRLRRYIVLDKINATAQGICCDDDYIYTCWSAEAGVMSGNILQIYDWKGNHICDRNITNSYELESLFRMDSDEAANYYATFHHSYQSPYQAKEAYKEKWKKVKRRVKWKKVKVKGRWKWKYKKVKVWKYKTKYRTVTKYHIYRNAYMMSLGELTRDETIIHEQKATEPTEPEETEAVQEIDEE